jgi:hypothetical protein
MHDENLAICYLKRKLQHFDTNLAPSASTSSQFFLLNRIWFYSSRGNMGTNSSNASLPIRCLETEADENNFCATNCVGLEACMECQCTLVEVTSGGAWGPVMDIILCLSPIIFLVVVTLIPKPLPTTISLPLAAFFMWAIRLMYLNADVILTCGYDSRVWLLSHELARLSRGAHNPSVA